MNCPVCHKNDISELALYCPDCGTDLVQFVMIDQLEEKYVSHVKKKIAQEGELLQLQKQYEEDTSKSRRRINRLIFLLMLLPVWNYWCRPKQIVKEIQPDPRVDSLAAKIDDLKKEKDLMASQFVHKVAYKIKEGDNLESLGKLFYNNPQAGYQIGKDNNIETDFYYRRLPPGKTITIYFR